MFRSKSSGFTLIEIILVVGLLGIIATTAFVPMITTIKSLETAQSRWGNKHNVPDAAERLFKDMRLVIPNASFDSVKIIHNESLSNKADDRILMWSLSPKYEGEGAAVVAYKVIPEDSFSEDKPGLYRWVIFGQPSTDTTTYIGSSKTPEPMDIDTDDLEASDGTLVLSSARGLRFYFPNGDEWIQQDYSGGLPTIIRMEITTGKDDADSYIRTETFIGAIQEEETTESAEAEDDEE